MSKIDKSKYSKEQIKALLAERKHQKEVERLQESFAKKSITSIIQRQLPNYGFVIGNGTSRSEINLAKLRNFGKLYGCNALYREFEPDYLVAVDVKMINEIAKTDWQLTHSVWTNPNKSFKNYTGFNYFSPSKGWSSGPTALWLASQHKYNKIFMLGFDYKGLNAGKTLNNIYADTFNYKKSTDTATYYGNWLKQTIRVLKENPQITYYRVIAPDNFQPPELNNINNVKTIFTTDFIKMFDLS